jgi:NAD(P)H-hydrate epimerase
MIPVLTADQLRAADAHTIAHEPIPSIGLMERAAQACTERILKARAQGLLRSGSEDGCTVVMGMGNNGGDGAVVARLLHRAGWRVQVVRVRHRQPASPDNAVNWRRCLEEGIPCTEVGEAEPFGLAGDGPIIDALFGTGLNAPLAGIAKRAVEAINATGREVISIDMPSGLFDGDNASNDPHAIVRATWTLTLEAPKPALLLPENQACVGRLSVVPIGLDGAFIRSMAPLLWLMEERDAVALLPPRPWHGHKGTFGHALLACGGQGRMGAAVLAVNAALRSGAGLVTAHVPRVGVPILQSVAPEAMCSADAHGEDIGPLPPLAPFTAIGAGPGLGTGPAVRDLLGQLFQEAGVPLVLDADALNVLAMEPALMERLPKGTVLTPHPREFDRIAARASGSGFERLHHARAFAAHRGCIVVLKGRYTAVCASDGSVFFNPTGNPGMAKGGSGDALTGLLTGLLAQGMEPLHAARLSVYLHGLAGDLAAGHKGMDGMTAMDLVHALPEAWRHLRNAAQEMA